ncbi:MAG: penicillin-binding protein 1C [Phycisphaerae bacterium]|nr:penicillin-binding protein 1C [Phycisphaerae bacterium]
MTRLLIVALAVIVLVPPAMAILSQTFPFPVARLNRSSASVCVTDRHGTPLLQLVNSEEQWRFPISLDRMSPWLAQATVAVEDKRFRKHEGIDWLAVARAARQNVTGGRIVSGASTLTMQVCRMMDDRPRGLSAKLVESFRARQLEKLRTKDQILEAYLNVAPYGRNLRGVEAASLAYFGKHAADLSLGEAALLAGLPQAPGKLRPDRNPDAAKARRKIVLERMVATGAITAEQATHAGEEPVAIAAATARTQAGNHAAWTAFQSRPQGGRTTIDLPLQNEILKLARHRVAPLPPGTDASVVVIDLATGDIVAVVGSTGAVGSDAQVCGATAWRSPGSTLKPFVYAAAFEAKRANPDSTVYDLFIQRAGWSPNNFDGEFHGELSAADALRQSLNVPAILVAEEIGMDRCLGLMQSAGLTFRDGTTDRGGLSVVVGTAEVRLIDLVNAFATIGRGGVRKTPRLFMDQASASAVAMDANVCATLDAILSSRARTPTGMADLMADEIPWFMWKTGTSSGRRDAWAVGHNRRFAAGVWVGRFSGGGSQVYVGAEAAEPLLAQIFALPRVRVDSDPSPPKPWSVASPLPKPPEVSGPIRITYPADGARFLAIEGQAIVNPRVNRPDALQWFLHGRLIETSAASRLLLHPGQYELRCLAPSGQGSAVMFSVQ